MHRLFTCLLVSLVCSVTLASAAAFEQISPQGGYSGIEFKHLAMNSKGLFVAVSESRVFVGDAAQGKVAQVFAGDHIGFVLRDDATDHSHDQNHQCSLDILGHRLAINESGDYVVASHTMLFVGNAAGGEPRKVFEDRNVMFQNVAINDAGHYVAITGRGIVVGTTADAAASRIVDQAPGTFQGHSILSSNGSFGVEVGETHLALNRAGQFVATTGAAAFAGSVPSRKAVKLYEDSKVNFRQLQLAEDGRFVVVSTKNVFRGTVSGI